MMSVQLIWSSNQSKARVKAYGLDQPMLVQAHVAYAPADFMSQAGILMTICHVDAPDQMVESRFWGLVIPQNLVSSWRGALMLSQLVIITDSSLCDCWYAGSRHLHETDKPRLQQVVAQIGRRQHQQIMSLPVPPEIVGAVLEISSHEDAVMSTRQLLDEVVAGTLKYQPIFGDEPNQTTTATQSTANRFTKFLRKFIFH